LVDEQVVPGSVSSVQLAVLLEISRSLEVQVVIKVIPAG